MVRNPNVALLIPAFNAERWLADLLNDAAVQTIPFAEIVVYDDASTDRTASVARELGAKVIRGDINRGAGFARNRLFATTSAPLVHFHDADDRLLPIFCERMLMQQPDENTCVLCGVQNVDGLAGNALSGQDWTAINNCEDYLGYFLRTQCAMVVGVYPRRLVTQIGGFSEQVRGGEDYDFHVRLAKVGARFRAISDRLAVVRRFGGQTFTEKHLSKYLLDNLTIVEGYIPELGGRYSKELGFVLIDLAWRLFDSGDRGGTRRAIDLAASLGRVEISSGSRLFRFLSKVGGIENGFRFRKWKNRLRVH